MESIYGNGQDEEVIKKKEKRKDYFSEDYLTSDDLEIPEIPFLSQF